MCAEARQKSAVESVRTGYKITLVLLLIGATILGIPGLTGRGSSAGWYMLGGGVVVVGLAVAFQSVQNSVRARSRG